MVKIVTDSLADIPPEVAAELGINVIPLNIHFGDQTFRDGIDITTDAFYARVMGEKSFPTTTVPPVGEIVAILDRLAQESDGIVIITFSAELGAGYNIALEAKELVKGRYRVEVIDSRWAAMAQGLVAIAAAQVAQVGASVDEVVANVKRNIPRADIRMVFDTLEYMSRGGRIGKAKVFLSSVLRLRPVLGLKDGEVYPLTREHSRVKAMDHLFRFAAGFSHIDGLAVEVANTPGEADKLMERLSARFPEVTIYRTKVGPAVGAHVGPRVLSVSVLGDKTGDDS